MEWHCAVPAAGEVNIYTVFADRRFLWALPVDLIKMLGPQWGESLGEISTSDIIRLLIERLFVWLIESGRGAEVEEMRAAV